MTNEESMNRLGVSADAGRAISNSGGFAVLDFETTGLFPGGHDRVIEIGVVHVDRQGRIEGEWETLVNPMRDIGAQSIHNIRARDILDAPSFLQAAPQLITLLSGRVLVAHNASFDMGFLDAEFERIGYAPGTPIAVLCTMTLARDIIPGSGRSLSDCCAHFDITIDGAHCAGADAHATAELLGQYIHATENEPMWADAVASGRSPWKPLDSVDASWKPRPLKDTPSPHFLERIAQRLPDIAGTEAEQSYLALLDKVLIDHEISAHEAADIVTLADALELGRSACEKLHASYFRALTELAWADDLLTQLEVAELKSVALLLQISDDEVDRALAFPANRIAGPIDERAPIQVSGFHLRLGDLVVLTGEMTRARDDWQKALEAAGLTCIDHISKKVRLLVAADPDSVSGKASKARDYGIAIVTEDGLVRLLEAFKSGTFTE
jgi:DNA polymerase-3 subunit epsilon